MALLTSYAECGSLLSQHVQSDSSIVSVRRESAMQYDSIVGENPVVDNLFCEVAGKVVHVIARFSKVTDNKIVLRGSGAGWNWNNDRPHEQTRTSLFVRTFTFHVPTCSMHDTVEIKLVSVADDKSRRWQTGNNVQIDLSTYGHVAIVRVNDVSFE